MDELTDEQLRIRIAEFCGYGFTETGEPFRLNASGVHTYPIDGMNAVPNYPGSLDAMYEAEEHLAKVKISGCRDASDNQDFYHRNLIKVCWADQDFHQGFKVSHASARQRALTLVRTIGGQNE